MSAQSHRLVQVIGALKLAKGVLLVALATGGLALLGKNMEQELARFAHLIHADPGNRYFKMLLTKGLGVSPHLPFIVIGSLVYGAVFIVEGVGLLKQKRWAEYLSAIVTGSFLPLEAYEIFKQGSAFKAMVTALNIAIFIYLVIRLKRDKPNAKSTAKSARRQAGDRSARNA